MLFNSFGFWLFFFVVLVLYQQLRHRGQNVLLLIASYFFYGCWDWRFLGLILFSTLVDYCVALAIERINGATTLGIRSVASAWAGLRTFAPDESMVLGPDPDTPGFVWCVGQGGTGIQTAPAAGRLVADLMLDGTPSTFFDTVDLDLPALTPGRPGLGADRPGSAP